MHTQLMGPACDQIRLNQCRPPSRKNRSVYGHSPAAFQPAVFAVCTIFKRNLTGRSHQVIPKVLDEIALNDSAACESAVNHHAVSLPDFPFPDHLGQIAASLQAFGAQKNPSGVSVKTVAYRGTEAGTGSLSVTVFFLMKISSQPLIHGEIPGSCFLREYPCGLGDDQDVFIFIENRIPAQKTTQLAVSLLFFNRIPVLFLICRRSGKFLNRLVGQKENDTIALFHFFTPVRFFTLQSDVFFAEHFVNKRRGRLRQPSFQIFIEPLSALIPADQIFPHFSSAFSLQAPAGCKSACINRVF